MAVVSVDLSKLTTSSLRSLAICASRLVNGSSRRITSGLGAKALAKATLCCCPPESSCGNLSRKLVKLHSSKTSLSLPSLISF